MSPEKQRIAIAKACGFQKTPEVDDSWFKIFGDQHFYFNFKDLPNYLKDLNAMHEAEKSLKGSKDDEHSEVSAYGESLIFVCGFETKDGPDVYQMDLIMTTAAQRAEAFLKTLNLWTES